MHGGAEGRALALERRGVETHPTLVKALERLAGE